MPRDGSDNGGNNDCDGDDGIGGLLGRILDWEGDVVTERGWTLVVPPPDARCNEDGRQTVMCLCIHYVKILLASNLMFKILLPTAYWVTAKIRIKF